jgi:hypothetical protein
MMRGAPLRSVAEFARPSVDEDDDALGSFCSIVRTDLGPTLTAPAAPPDGRYDEVYAADRRTG